MLAKFAGLPKPAGPELVQETFRQIAPAEANFDAAWNKFLHDGFLEGATLGRRRTLSFMPAAARSLYRADSRT